MKVLFTTNIPAPYRIDFFNELSKYCDLTVIFERGDAKDRESEWLNNKKIEFKYKCLDGIKMGKDSSFCPQIIKSIKKEAFDIIIVGGYSTPTGMFLINYLKHKKTPFILNCDGGFIKEESKIKYKIKKYFIGSAKFYITTGKETIKYLLHYGAKSNKIYTYPFSSIRKRYIQEIKDTNEIKEIKEKNGIKEEKVILAVGRFIYGKGFDILIKAMKQLDRKIGVYIIGGLPNEEYLKLKKENQLDNVHFLEFKIDNKLEEYYKIANVFVLPTREDVWGLVINEAMAKGLPIITTDKCIAGLELIENEKNGYIVPANDDKSLKEAIEKIINNEELQKTMGKNNVEKIEYYTIENMAKEHAKIFNEIMNEGK